LTRIRRALAVLCALAVIWAIVIAVTGGFAVSLHSIRLSSRSPRTAAMLALAAGVAVWVLSTSVERRRAGDQLRLASGRVLRAGPAPLIGLAGIVLVMYQWAAARPLWLDEEMIALNLRDRPIVNLAGLLWLGQSAPFGWLAVQRAAVLSLGTSELALRFVPMLFGIATLVTAVWVGYRWMSRAGAVVLVGLCSWGQWLSFYTVELKHYSADAFWALMLPALATWVIEAGADRSDSATHRAAVWWAAAAIGQWFANGALLVTPACALVLLIVSWRRDGWRAAGAFALFGCGWLASFGLHYLVTMRHTLSSEYLTRYWSFALPPGPAGSSAVLSWLAGQLKPFALKPGGTGLWVMFWVSAACGFALATSRTLGLLMTTVPLSAFAWAALRAVPFYERLSLWVVPALYVGIALFCDSTVRLGREGYLRRSPFRLGLAVVIAFAGCQLCWDIVKRGTEDLRFARPRESNHQLNDRAAVGWLMRQHEPGDVVMTTQTALPAIWWYGRIPISTGDFPGSRQSDGSPIFEVGHQSPGPDCQRNQLGDALKNAHRVLVYLGMRFEPDGFDELLLNSLSEIGVLRALQHFDGIGGVAVMDLRPAFAGDHIPADPSGGSAGAPARLNGCIAVRRAIRW
jgi:hypothetical protein